MTSVDDRSHQQSKSSFRPLEREIIDKGWEINQERPFTYRDFGCSPRSFRNSLSRINTGSKARLIVTLFVSGLGAYAIRGSPAFVSSMTHPRMVGGGPKELNLIQTLCFLGDQVEGVHDIHLWFACPALYAALPLFPSPDNRDKRLSPVLFSKGRAAQVVAHSTGSVSVVVKSTEEPFPRDNLTELLLILEEVWRRLVADYVKDVGLAPPPADWVVKVWHCNKDSGEIAGPDIQVTFRSFSGVLARYYRRSDGRSRLEQIESPGKSIRDLGVGD